MTSFAEARRLLLATRDDYEAAVAGFRWPDASGFNWALDWFDAELAASPESRDRPALRILDLAAGTDRGWSFADMDVGRAEIVTDGSERYLEVRGSSIGDLALPWEDC